MEYAEQFAMPFDGKMGLNFPRQNDFREVFFLRWGRIKFNVFWGEDVNVKVILKVYRDDCWEQYVVETDPYNIQWNSHKRVTRDFYLHPFPQKHGRVKCVKFAYIVHVDERSIPSQHEYIFMDGYNFDDNGIQRRQINKDWATQNNYRTYEVDAGRLQREADHLNRYFNDIGITPKFTKGQTDHPYHPKRFIHDHIDKVIYNKRNDPDGMHSIKVCVDCIDDYDFINHLIHAHYQGVTVQCQVDWRKMTLTNSDNYARLKRAGVEILGIVCTPKHHLIEVAPDMHNKFIIFDDEDAIIGSFNITFDRWGANWESGMTFHSRGVCHLLDNIFHSIRGGVIQRYGIDPHSHFNLLYTFGRHALMNGKYYRPHHAILAEIRRARHSIRICLFLIGNLLGEHGDSVIEALVEAKHRGVHVHVILNGHLAHQGDPGREYSMADELQRPLLPSVYRLRTSGVWVNLAYGLYDQPIPYSPLHPKYCIIDEHVVIEGSFNWYNTSVYSHDLVIIVANHHVAQSYLYEFNQIQREFRLY